ncbi:MAG: Inosose dehydratase [bacterium ADurb.Bin478]|nr:MAG: Inosose dehydratase [bacterium ADurb.Bin478]
MFDQPVSRRQFGRWTLAATALGTLAAGCRTKKKLGIGIQLYTLRDLMQNDFTGTLEKVAGLGYPAVEFAGYGGLAAPQVRDLLKRLNLRCCGTHEGYGALTPDALEKTIAFNAAISSPYIICPSMPREFREKGADGVGAFADAMNQAGEKIKQAGMQLCYHNHDFEFQTTDGPSIFDQLLQGTDAELVKMEVDTYWVQHAGLDPIALIKKLQNRCPLLHMKDMTAGEPHTFAPVGQGVMNIKGIIEAGRQAGVQWLVVEQDRCEGSVLDAVAGSYQHLHRLAG